MFPSKSSQLSLLCVASFFLCLSIFLFSPANALEVGEDRTFKVTAYYSPVAGQSRYTTGSYAGDIRLQGQGVAAADGTPVYVGMISAPYTYPYGTKIYIEGMGVGTVHDRGGAIYAGNGYDRLDIWMGYGDAGLTRALTWGIKTVPGKIMPEDTPNSFELGGEHMADNSSSVSPESIVVASSAYPEVFNEDYELGNTGDEVEKFQKFLVYEGFLFTKEFSIYNTKTENAVYRFQRSHGVVESLSSPGAGRWGPQTRKKANEILYKRNANLDAFSRDDAPYVFSENLWYGKELEGSDEIRTLQRFLKIKGFYKGSVSGKYSRITQYGVFLFQKEHGIVNTWQDAGAGAWGPKTRTTANSL